MLELVSDVVDDVAKLDEPVLIVSIDFFIIVEMKISINWTVLYQCVQYCTLY